MQHTTTVPIDNAPEHAAALGRLVARWAVLEVGLQLLLSALLKGGYREAHFIYQEISATKTKITMLRRMNHHLGRFVEPQKTKISMLLADAARLNRKRNDFVHALWGEGREKDCLTRMSTTFSQDHREADSKHEQFSSTNSGCCGRDNKGRSRASRPSGRPSSSHYRTALRMPSAAISGGKSLPTPRPSACT